MVILGKWTLTGIKAANIGPYLRWQSSTVSWQMSILRSSKRSATFLSESRNRMRIITAKRMMSGLVLK